MSNPIEDYALIGNTSTAALVAKNGSIDWLCMPRFDSGACFAAMLGSPGNGRWSIAPEGDVLGISRKYLDETLILETEFHTGSGTASIVDFMPIGNHDHRVDLIRIVKGLSGSVRMKTELIIRFDYGQIVPWVTSRDFGIRAIAGPDALELRSPIKLRGENFTTVAEFAINEGEVAPFTLTWYPSHEPEPAGRHPLRRLNETEQWWRQWASRSTVRGEWRDAVLRSIITLKALTYSPTGGIVAAPTTSLPECIGGVRNWDYRFCWLRDATFTLYSLLLAGFREEAYAFQQWLLRSVAGRPQELQIMYGLSGERRLTELELDWLSGYENSRPVRIGNAAHRQLQLDVYGELMDTMHVARRHQICPESDSWQMQKVLLEFLETQWKQPDEGIWEVRGPRRHFTHSKVMAWVAMDRAIKDVERFRLEGPIERWRALRKKIHDDVCAQGFNRNKAAFVQYYGSDRLDASLLMIPLVGFLPASDPRVIGTVEAIQRELMSDGFVQRYHPEEEVDGLPGREGAFLACTFWLADNLAMMHRYGEAREIFQRLLGLRNDVGLLSEEYDVSAKRMVGNFPQAFSHVSLVNTAHNLMMAQGPAHHRAECDDHN